MELNIYKHASKKKKKRMVIVSNVNMLYKNKYLCGFIKATVVLLSYTWALNASF